MAKRGFADVIKAIHFKTQEDTLDYPGGPDVITGTLTSRELSLICIREMQQKSERL